MGEDSVSYDSLDARPLPKWLIDQKEGLTLYKPPEINIKDDNSLYVAISGTGLLVLLIVIALTVYIRRKKKNI